MFNTVPPLKCLVPSTSGRQRVRIRNMLAFLAWWSTTAWAMFVALVLLRLLFMLNIFTASAFYLGRWRVPAYISMVIFNVLIVAVDVLPFFFPVDVDSFKFAPVIFSTLTIFGILSWWLTSGWARSRLSRRSEPQRDRRGPRTDIVEVVYQVSHALHLARPSCGACLSCEQHEFSIETSPKMCLMYCA